MRSRESMHRGRSAPGSIDRTARRAVPARPASPARLTASLVAVAALLLSAAAPATARFLTHQDCREGGDFIRNAALSRDNGISARVFTERLEGDLQVVGSLPVESRWFVYGDAEADLLRRQVAEVFEQPQPPDAHLRNFLASCLQLQAGQMPEVVLAPPAPQSAR